MFLEPTITFLNSGNRTYMVEVTKPMGSYHIIDGEKVSVKYRGQDKTCAKCHKTESVCPGKAMARECTSERVLLLAHMKEHWVKVGFRPDTQDLNEVDELDFQIGSKEPEPAPVDSLRPDHSEKYTSVIINGFSKTAEETDIYNILLEGGLPEEHKIESIQRNDNGRLIIENLDSGVCVSLTNHINGKKFFNRNVFVTSVVQKTPTKETIEDDEAPTQDDKSSTNDSASDASSESDGETIPLTVTKPPSTKLFSNISGKRPAAASPEESSDNKKKEKKKSKNAATSDSVRSSSRHVKPTNKE